MGGYTSQQLVQDRPQAIDVRRRANFVRCTAGLFGRHVRGRADRGPGLR